MTVARPEGRSFKATEEHRRTAAHRSRPDQTTGQVILRKDVALFARAFNLHNWKRTVSICNEMYGSGTHGVVRAQMDARFRDRNADYIRQRSADAEACC